MIKFVLHSISNAFVYITHHPQLITTIILVIIVPISYIFSAQQFLSAGTQNQERLEKERIGILHDVFASYIETVHFDGHSIQPQIETIIANNPDIKDFLVARDDGDVVTILASDNRDNIQKTDDNVDAYRISNIQNNESIITPYVEKGVRFWNSYRRVTGSDGVVYYIFTRTSLAHIDSLFFRHILSAYVWLAGILIIVMMLIFRHVRMIDYAYLYQETKKVSEMKDMFTNMVAHELRAPLTAIRGFASMIRQRQGVDEEAKRYAISIEDASERLVTIVGD